MVEPAAPDARKHADGRDTAFLKLAAGLLGVPFDTLRQRELRRQQQRWVLFGAVSLVLSGVFAVLAWQATVARDAARVAQARAELEAQTARQTSDFMVSLFEVSDPSESRGNSITAREVLDRGVNRIEHAEFARPLIKARLLGTMGTVYSYLGLYPRAEELLARSDRFVEVADPGSEEAAQRFDLLWELGELQLRRGDYPSARAALAKIGTPDTRLPDYARREAKRRNLLGNLDFYEGKDAPAREHYQAALAALSQGGVDDAIQRARALQGSAAILSYAGEAEAAIPGLEEAFDLLLKHHGEDHRYTLSVLDQLGVALYQCAAGPRLRQRRRCARACRSRSNTAIACRAPSPAILPIFSVRPAVEPRDRIVRWRPWQRALRNTEPVTGARGRLRSRVRSAPLPLPQPISTRHSK